jgi:hypothetical protein
MTEDTVSAERTTSVGFEFTLLFFLLAFEIGSLRVEDGVVTYIQ